VIIENPDPSIKAKWGPLAHVSEAERLRILALPFGGFKPAVMGIEKQLKEMEKQRKRKESEQKRFGRMDEQRSRDSAES
jgi:hypothetical protein